jgi:hypothetical protein
LLAVAVVELDKQYQVLVQEAVAVQVVIALLLAHLVVVLLLNHLYSLLLEPHILWLLVVEVMGELQILLTQQVGAILFFQPLHLLVEVVEQIIRVMLLQLVVLAVVVHPLVVTEHLEPLTKDMLEVMVQHQQLYTEMAVVVEPVRLVQTEAVLLEVMVEQEYQVQSQAHRWLVLEVVVAVRVQRLALKEVVGLAVVELVGVEQPLELLVQLILVRVAAVVVI